MSRFGSLSAALRLVRGGKSNSSKEIPKIKILSQLLNDGKIDFESSPKDSFVEIKATQYDFKVPFKNLQILKIHLSKSDLDLLSKSKSSQSALGLLDKDQVEQMSTTVVIVTLTQFGYKFIIGLKEFVNNPRAFLNDILNRGKRERDMRECIIKISKDLEKIQEYLGIDQDGGVDEDGEGNAEVNPSDGLKGNGNAGGGIAVAKAGTDDVEEGSSAANPSAVVKENGSSAANPSAVVKENGSSAANPRAGVKDEEGGGGSSSNDDD